ncbi:acyl-ACP--UDP-N-acetylglucosamine O-acyltransferase [Kibdelosporangium phytohabitans]|uniref:UDP-N-acetylglucosamine acyltransferase n=1 Tax=Kibdelosporangium phytohabitans TaxID=860235 RepID=A0A0N9I467_9PSEU|nr:acyl-ACP--UDP-N-acetylglucosamine O-acyltransferase [Kibdelosporangium phytohabitans]ALG09596.1 UDP-N-acetylglucosamine acyltransferase [Kibdelosporangium phytohabitans]MBE1469069.1 UDP-N-acetylglucosamine acyltransferase [Kibdelosporangium phytohabitans]
MAELPGVHPTAVVADDVELADDVRIGPYAVIHDGVRLAPGVRIDAHAVIGGEPQDLSFAGGRTCLEIGRGTAVREGAVIHRSTTPDRPTRIGASCLIMGQSHIGHDCWVGDGVVVCQQSALAGHVTVGDHAVIGGMTGVHQHVRVGSRAMVAAMAKVNRDVLPFSAVDGNPATHRALNAVGLRRAGIRGDEYAALRAAFHRLREGQDPGDSTELVGVLKDFLAARSTRGISPFHRGRCAS